jgi:hypothetical protein
MTTQPISAYGQGRAEGLRELVSSHALVVQGNGPYDVHLGCERDSAAG